MVPLYGMEPKRRRLHDVEKLDAFNRLLDSSTRNRTAQRSPRTRQGAPDGIARLEGERLDDLKMLGWQVAVGIDKLPEFRHSALRYNLLDFFASSVALVEEGRLFG